MKPFGTAMIILFVALLAVAVGLLIAASVQGMTVVEMIKSWFETAAETVPPVEETVEATSLIINSLKI